MKKQKTFDLNQSSFVYLFLIASFICINIGAATLAILMPQVIKSYALEITTVLELIAYIPLLIYALKSDVDVKSALRLKPLKFKQILLTVLLVLAMYVIVTFISTFWQNLLASWGANLEVEDILNDLTNKPVWFSIFLLCIFAPFFEELTFRGMILSGYSAYRGFWKAAILTGIMFGLLHGFLPTIVPAAFLGVAIAAVVMYTGSIFAGMIFHALHNLLAYTMVMDHYFLDLPWKLNLAPSVNTPSGQFSKFVWISCWTVIAVFAVVFIFKALKKGYVPPERKIMPPHNKKHGVMIGFAFGGAILLVILSSAILFLPKGLISG